MKFKVMTRKGHKQQLKELNIPLVSDLTSGVRDTRQAKSEAYEEMKQKVLDYERRQEEEDYQGEEDVYLGFISLAHLYT